MTYHLHSDLTIIGGGPAGCAAAVMAASLGMTTTLVEPHALCHKLHTITHLANVLGGYTTGADLATAIARDVSDTSGCDLRLGRQAIEIHADDQHVRTLLDNQETLLSRYAVVATGTRPRALADLDWITTAIKEPPPLWQATASALANQHVLVIGGDRPLGTLLRSMPHPDTRFTVAHHPTEQYKVQEIRDDPRVTLLPTHQLTLQPDTDGTVTAHLTTDTGAHTITASRHFANVGHAPAPPGGDLAADPDGYCPPERQHPRILTAGDLRAARYQRIMTASGSGAETALTAYYTQAPPPSPRDE